MCQRQTKENKSVSSTVSPLVLNLILSPTYCCSLTTKPPQLWMSHRTSGSVHAKLISHPLPWNNFLCSLSEFIIFLVSLSKLRALGVIIRVPLPFQHPANWTSSTIYKIILFSLPILTSPGQPIWLTTSGSHNVVGLCAACFQPWAHHCHQREGSTAYLMLCFCFQPFKGSSLIIKHTLSVPWQQTRIFMIWSQPTCSFISIQPILNCVPATRNDLSLCLQAVSLSPQSFLAQEILYIWNTALPLLGHSHWLIVYNSAQASPFQEVFPEALSQRLG